MLLASVACAGVSRTFKVRDLSPGGACIEGELLPHDGSNLIFRRGGQFTRARVAWASRERFGLEFSDSLDVRDALRTVSRPKLASPPPTSRPGLKPRKFTEAERLVMERWATSPQAIGD
jgi:hypothetical protein